MKRSSEYYRGCLLGGAVGDALGRSVEFMKRSEIVSRYGEQGIRDLECGNDGKAEITDDTQMTLFTAEGLLRTESRYRNKGIADAATAVYHAYLRWLHTQGYEKKAGLEWIYDGWLMDEKELFHRRSPGNMCLTALAGSRPGSVEEPVNNSKGCGGVMRVAPVGLFCRRENAFSLAVECAALTHGHPSGYLPAGVLAYVIALLLEGVELKEAVVDAMGILGTYPGHGECSLALERALELAGSEREPSEAVSLLGEGWVGEEALAIAVYCALRFRDNYRGGLVAAVNHDGDSDSTGAITGNILGAYLGVDGIPGAWLKRVELADVISQIADDLFVQYVRLFFSAWQE